MITHMVLYKTIDSIYTHLSSFYILNSAETLSRVMKMLYTHIICVLKANFVLSSFENLSPSSKEKKSALHAVKIHK